MKINNNFNIYRQTETSLTKWTIGLLFTVILLGSNFVANAQLVITRTGPANSDFQLDNEPNIGHVDGFDLPAEIINHIGEGFSIKVEFGQGGLDTNEAVFLFGVGLHRAFLDNRLIRHDTFEASLMAYLQSGQLIIHRRIDTPNGEKMFPLPSWNTSMYTLYPNDPEPKDLTLYFWLNEFAMKMYMYSGSSDLTQHDPNGDRACELQFYGMNGSYIKQHLTSNLGTPSILVPRRNSSFIKLLEISVADPAITGSPIDADHVKGKEPGPEAVNSAPAARMECDCPVGGTTIDANTSFFANREPIDLSAPEFQNIPVSYTAVSYGGSVPKEINAAATSDFEIFPVPTSDQISVQIKAYQGSSGNLEMVDINGIVILRQKIELTPGINQFDLSLKSLAVPSGVYVFHANIESDDGDSKLFTKRIIVE